MLLIIKVEAEWCKPCKELSSDFEASQEFNAIVSSHFLAVKIDAGAIENQEFLMEFRIHSYPSVIISDPKMRQGYLELKGRQPMTNYLESMHELMEFEQSRLIQLKKELSRSKQDKETLLEYSKELQRFHLPADGIVMEYIAQLNFELMNDQDMEIVAFNYNEDIDRLYQNKIMAGLHLNHSASKTYVKLIIDKILVLVYQRTAIENDNNIMFDFVEEHFELLSRIVGVKDKKGIFNYTELLVEHGL